MVPRRAARGRRRPSAPAGSTPTPRRCRSSPSTAARACSTPSSTCPSSTARPRADRAALFHDDDRPAPTLDVAGAGPQWAAATPRTGPRRPARSCALYVALTRAQSQVVTWWAPDAEHAAHAGLTGCCSAGGPATREVPDRQPVHDDATPRTCCGRHRAARRPGASRSSVAAGRRRSPAAPAAAAPLAVAGVRPRGRHRLAAHVLLRADPGRGAARSRSTSEPEVAGHEDEEPVRRAAERRRSARARRASRRRAGLADGRPARRAPTSARWSTRCSSTPTRRRPTCAPSCATPRRASSCAGGRSTSTPDELAEALLPLQHTPLGPLAGGLTLADIPLRDRLRELDFEFPLAGGDRPGRAAARRAPAATWPPLLRAHLAADDPMRAVRRPARVAVARRPAAARLPHRLDRRGAAAPAGDGSTASSSSTTRPTARRARRAADRARLHAGADGRGDAALALPAAGAALLRRAAPLPALAAARLRPERPPRRRALPLRARHVRPGHPGGRRPARAGSSRGSRRRRWCVALSDLLDGPAAGDRSAR